MKTVKEYLVNERDVAFIRRLTGGKYRTQGLRQNAEMDELNEIVDAKSNPYSYGLSPKEIVEAKKNIEDRFHGTYYQNVENMIPNGKMDKVSQELFIKGLTQLEIINMATAKETQEELKAIEDFKDKLPSNSAHDYKRLTYKDINGNPQVLQVGVEKYYVTTKKREISPDTHEERIVTETKPAYKYYEKKFDARTNDYTDVKYISESEFNEKIGTYCRCNVKNEQGIGEEMFSLNADDGTRFIITDARDDTYVDPMTGKSANSFEDGFKEINMYRVTPDGQKIQMTKNDVVEMVKQNGINIKDINSRNTHGKGLGFSGKMEQAGQKAGEITKKVIKNSLGMDLTTSTRA